MKSSMRFVVVLILILVVGVVVNTWSYLGEAHVERKDLKDFPQSIGTWQKTGNDQTLDGETLKVILREAGRYLRPGGLLVVEVGNTETAVRRAFRKLPFVWLDFERAWKGDDRVIRWDQLCCQQVRDSKRGIQEPDDLLVSGKRAKCRERVLGQDLHRPG